MSEGRIDNERAGQIADGFVQLCAAQQITLDYSPESLLIFDAILDSVAAVGVAGNEGMIEAMGAYYGEALRRNLGGNWHFDLGEEGDWALECPAESGQMLSCAATMYKHFDRGGKSVAALYDLVASGLDKPTIQRPEAAAKKPAAKKPAAKKPAAKKKTAPKAPKP